MFRCPWDGWPSGLRRTPGKRVGPKGSREFESHSVRVLTAYSAPACRLVPISGCAAPSLHRGDNSRGRISGSAPAARGVFRPANAVRCVFSSGVWWHATIVQAFSP